VCVCNAHMQQLTELTTVRRTLIKSFDGRVFIKLKQKTKQLVAFPISDGKTVAGNCGLPDLKIEKKNLAVEKKNVWKSRKIVVPC
jgi:hypothetical protein